ncbi:MAG: hypothetical protein GXY03_05380, partial [Solirubrobacterales bacterium]|nr:hypothetical protein [Solirubrobacterales bacterium]
VADAESAAAFALECEDLWWAPGVGGGGVRTATRPVLGMHAASAPRAAIGHRVTVTAHRFDRAEAAHAGR